eukprot:TRINITY_DN7314_c0_g1_i2.p1 TRINITY_DN7314_c0_g1~~TRINITY_DN7314_c0_g1_i2.p1  ORF type:complete len:854 (-),score=109.08 TRINITY_DN7314_c0_g1_i2:2097-4355(-)
MQEVPHSDLDILQKSYMEELLLFENQVRNITLNDGFNYYANCLQPKKNYSCLVSSVFLHWDFDMDKLINDNSIHFTVANEYIYKDTHVPITPSMVLGGADIKFGRAFYAMALKSSYFFDNSQTTLKSNHQWQKELIRLMDIFNANHENITVLYFSGESIEESVAYSLEKDWWIAVIGFGLMFIWVILVLGESKSLLHSKIAVGITGFLFICLSLALSLSISSVLNVQISAVLFQTTPAILLCIGIDNIFVITKVFKKFREQNYSAPSEDIVGKTISTIGISLTLPVISICLSFLFIHFYINIPIIRAMSIQLVISVLINYLFQIIVFPAILSLDDRRMKLKRYDLFCCIRSSFKEAEYEKILNQEKFNEKPQTSFWTNLSSIFYVYKPLSAIVIIILMGIVASSVYSSAHITIDMKVNDLIPKHSTVSEYLEIEKKYWEYSVVGFITLNNIDFSDWNITIQSEYLLQELETSCLILENPIDWFYDFRSWVAHSSHATEYRKHGNTVPQQYFYPWLKEFIEGMGVFHTLDLVFDNNTLTHARYTVFVNQSISVVELIENSKEIKAILSNYSMLNASFFDPTSFVADQFDDIKLKTLIVLLVCIGTVVLLNSVFMHWYYVFLSLILSVVIGGSLISLHYLFGMGITLFSTLSLVASICIGFEFYGNIYRVHSIYMNNTEDRKNDVMLMTNFLGNYVFLGAISSILAVAMLLAVDYYLVRYYIGVLWLSIFFIVGINSVVAVPMFLQFKAYCTCC